MLLAVFQTVGSPGYCFQTGVTDLTPAIDTFAVRSILNPLQRSLHLAQRFGGDRVYAKVEGLVLR